MKTRLLLAPGLMFVIIVSTATAVAKDKKKQPQRGMLESMQSVPCGVKHHGINGLGSVWASAGLQHVNSDEKLCPQYLFRTDDMDYHIRPADIKHAVLLPVGREGEFKIKKNHLYLKIPDGDKKARAYQVISMEPNKSPGDTESASYKSTHVSENYQRIERPTNGQAVTQPGTPPPP